jgi:hypothetical protein
MEIQVADQRILLFSDQLTEVEALQKASAKKTDAFGAINKISSFLSKPKDEDFELIYQEHRFQPFWHVAAKAKYVYDRTAEYQVPVSAKEVQSITYQNTDYANTNNHFHLSVTEHCLQNEADEVFVDGVTGKQNGDLKKYLSLSPEAVSEERITEVTNSAIVVPPQTRVSAIMRDSLSKMIKGIQADKILEEQVEVTCIDLYYHPIYAFQYRWTSKAKEAITEVDALTGEVRAGTRTFNEYLGKVLDTNFLFDVGADAAGMFIPGGSIAVKLAKKYIDSRK